MHFYNSGIRSRLYTSQQRRYPFMITEMNAMHLGNRFAPMSYLFPIQNSRKEKIFLAFIDLQLVYTSYQMWRRFIMLPSCIENFPSLTLNKFHDDISKMLQLCTSITPLFKGKALVYLSMHSFLLRRNSSSKEKKIHASKEILFY